MLPVLFALAGCGSVSDAPIAPDGEEHALDDAAFRFCHVPGANAIESQPWCSLLDDESSARCPGLVETCAGAVTEDPRGCDEGRGAGDGADGLGGAPEPPPPESPLSCDSPSAPDLSGVMRWIAALGVAALVLVVARLVWTTLGARLGGNPPERPVAAASARKDELAAPIPEGPPRDLLAAARAALREGRAGDAVLLARGAALRRLGEVGKLVLHRSRTDREYARRLVSEPVLQTELRHVVAAAEEVRFGGHEVTLGAAASAIAAAERILATLAAACLALWLGASDAHAQDYSAYRPGGDAALLPLLRAYGYDPGWRLSSLAELDDATDVLLLDLTRVHVSDEHWDGIHTWLEAGGVLLVGGDASEAFPELGVYSIATDPPDLEVAPDFARAGLPAPDYAVMPGYYVGGSGRPLVHVLGDDGGAAVELLDVGAGVVVAIADAQLLWNGAFVSAANERFLGELVYLGQALEGWPVSTPARVQLATSAAASESSAQGSATSPLAALARAGVLLAVLQAMLTWVVAGVRRGFPFLPLRDPPVAGRQHFSEHVVALGRRYHQRGDSAWALHRLAALWVGRLGRSGLELAAQRAGYTPASARTWAEGIEALAATPEPALGGGFGAGGARRARVESDLSRMEELWRVTRKEPHR